MCPLRLQANAAADELRALLMAKCTDADELTVQLHASRRAAAIALEQVSPIKVITCSLRKY
jgi:hypothetical protein